MLVINTPSIAQAEEDLLSVAELKKLSVEELMNIEVTSVSKRVEKLMETASAIQVITREDILNFGATRLPEALRLATNLEVAQVDAGQWAISARGFNSTTGNKLLVLIDGRSVYSPLFAGVFWDIQDFLLDDVERIEVISGPGGTLWGANAVNGVINIITRSGKDTHGLLVKGGVGTELRKWGALRYGGAIGNDLHFRVYGKYTDRDGAISADGQDAKSDWFLGQGGFRLDWEASQKDLVMLQADLYRSEILVNDSTDTKTKGGNMLGRWSHSFSDNADLELQLYIDRVHRSTTRSFNDILNTFDFDFQHHFKLGKRNDIVWGGGYRHVEDNFEPGTVVFVPQHLTLPTVSAFIQDEIALSPEKIYLTIGTKALHNYYTGFEFQPGIRLAWKSVHRQQMLWGAITRAVRTPSRVDRDLIVLPFFEGRSNFKSEELLAFELGYRMQPHKRFSLSLATYYNDFDNIRSVEQVNPPLPAPLEIGNGQRGEAFGAELTMDYEIMDWWRIRAGYTTLNLDIRAKPGSTDVSAGSSEAADPEHYFSIRSSVELSKRLKFYQAFRYVSELAKPMDVPDYSELDLRIAWQPIERLELSVTGQNLLHKHHAEFGRAATRKEIERNIYFKVVWEFINR